MNNDFVSWLIGEMNNRGWTNSELARRAGVAPSAVSMLISGQTNPGMTICNGIARAFKMPPERVFRLAGLLPALDDPDAQQLTYLQDHFKHLSSRVREDILAYVTYRYQQEQEHA